MAEKNIHFWLRTLRRDVFLVVRRVLGARVVGATSSESFLTA